MKLNPFLKSLENVAKNGIPKLFPNNETKTLITKRTWFQI